MNSITISLSNKLRRVRKKKHIPLSQRNFFFQNVRCHYNSLETRYLRTLYVKRRHSDALFSTTIYNGAKCCSWVLQTVEISASSRSIRNFSMFCCSYNPCPPVRCPSVPDVAFKSTHNFRNLYKNLGNADLFSLVCSSFRTSADTVTGTWLLRSAR
jgi:hypothetical protein